jgi:hypothetical protein
MANFGGRPAAIESSAGRTLKFLYGRERLEVAHSPFSFLSRNWTAVFFSSSLALSSISGADAGFGKLIA